MTARTMVQGIIGGIDAAKDAVTPHETENKKIADLSKDMKEYGSDTNATTDYGIKIPDHDHFLKIVNADRTGPHLLEDQIGREKVGISPSRHFTDLGLTSCRSCDSTMSVFRNVWYMLAAPPPSAGSSFMRVPRTCPPLGC